MYLLTTKDVLVKINIIWYHFRIFFKQINSSCFPFYFELFFFPPVYLIKIVSRGKFKFYGHIYEEKSKENTPTLLTTVVVNLLYWIFNKEHL